MSLSPQPCYFIGEGREAKQREAQRPIERQLTVQIPQQGGPWGVGVCRLQRRHEHHCQHASPSNRYEGLMWFFFAGSQWS